MQIYFNVSETNSALLWLVLYLSCSVDRIIHNYSDIGRVLLPVQRHLAAIHQCLYMKYIK